MFKSIAITIVVLIAALLAYAATKPDTFRVERSANIKAPPEKVFAYLNNFKQWSAWSPWEKLDPDLKRTMSGPPAGKGSVYEWEGNGKAGKGRMEITESTPASKLVIKLDFLKPFEAHNTAEFSLKPSGDSTQVNWAMFGPNLYIGKVMSVFFSMDSMVGGDFEKGLATLKTEAEK
jgi:uncharacterized protein YndB with AHSA1/START domain